MRLVQMKRKTERRASSGECTWRHAAQTCTVDAPKPPRDGPIAHTRTAKSERFGSARCSSRTAATSALPSCASARAVLSGSPERSDHQLGAANWDRKKSRVPLLRRSGQIPGGICVDWPQATSQAVGRRLPRQGRRGTRHWALPLSAARLGCHVQRCHPERRARFDVGPVVQKLPHHVGAAPFRCVRAGSSVARGTGRRVPQAPWVAAAGLCGSGCRVRAAGCR